MTLGEAAAAAEAWRRARRRRQRCVGTTGIKMKQAAKAKASKDNQRQATGLADWSVRRMKCKPRYVASRCRLRASEQASSQWVCPVTSTHATSCSCERIRTRTKEGRVRAKANGAYLSNRGAVQANELDGTSKTHNLARERDEVEPGMVKSRMMSEKKDTDGPCIRWAADELRRCLSERASGPATCATVVRQGDDDDDDVRARETARLLMA